MSKRAKILALFEQRTHPSLIITKACSPPADEDYHRRLRFWAIDCAHRAMHLLNDTPMALQFSMTALGAARNLAITSNVMPLITPDYDMLLAEVKRTAFAPQAEARLAAAFTVHHNVFLGALGAATHARKAIHNADLRNNPEPDTKELQWQAGRLKEWLVQDITFDQ